MKKFLLPFALCIIFGTTASAQATFHMLYGGTDSDFGSDVNLTKEGGYVLAGYTKSFGAGNNDAYIVCTDNAGGLLWSKGFGGFAEERANSVKQTADSGFIFTGYTTSFGAGGKDVYLVKTDKNGNIAWQKTFGGADDDAGGEVILTADGGYLVAGFSYSLGAVSAGHNGVYVIKLNANGDTTWTKVYAGTNTVASDEAGAVSQTADGGYIIAGAGVRQDSLNSDIYLLKISGTGAVEWNALVGGSGNESASSVQQTDDHGYIIGGSTNSFGAGSLDGYLIKTDSTGAIVWSKTYGGGTTDEGIHCGKTTDGGYFLVGETGSFGGGIKSFYFIKTDANGDTLRTKAYGDVNINLGISARQTPDNGFALLGYRAVYPGGKAHLYLVKTDANANSACFDNNTATVVSLAPFPVEHPTLSVSTGGTIATPASFNTNGGTVATICTTVGMDEASAATPDITLYPNPVGNELSIASNEINIKGVEIYTMLGERVSTLSPLQRSGEHATIDVSGLTSGIYFLKLESDEGVWTERFVKE